MKAAEGETTGRKTAGDKGKARPGAVVRNRNRRRVEVGESSHTTRAASRSTLMPVLMEGCTDHELRTLVQVMSSMDARIATLKQATEKAESTRAVATRSLAALIMRRELEDAQWAEVVEEEEREADRRMEEDAEYNKK
ncbi:hypothetical protein PLEOSDRAFT_1109944 [Pleurotus ostreatus PC15]|uniref:Uncharacterized protein n=2 Tax=Pleurotus TaxID=5320 RepID=A0A067N7E0_PLEO1|nr:hypothetical protein CCMSSC00406_0002917 [Pleurotus cornucopiae]KDQ22850.1 hypothetical protein PLEOSDRAFT_1109944 [Pleurotus ostreatus PC15]